ncbi:Collagen binding domain-containing protein [Peptostreptococcaceae bacterium pGA-8]|nr:Collagen binding domain-containing protein [Peptostreptococcaceae bacterium pGA-8]
MASTKQFFTIFVTAVLIVTMIVCGIISAQAENDATGNPKEVQINITNFQILHNNYKPDGQFLSDESVYLSLDWSAEKYGNTLKAGDYFDVTLPSQLRFPKDSPAKEFDLYVQDDQKNVIGKANVTPYDAGGTVRVVLTDYVNNRSGIHGIMYLDAFFIREKLNLGQDNTLNISSGGTTVSKVVPISEIVNTDIKNEILEKWSETDPDVNGQVTWNIRINHKKGDNISGGVITDKLSVENGSLDGVGYIPGSFILKKVTFDEKGNIVALHSEENVSERVELSENNTAFRFAIGDISNKQYLLTYKTSYVSDVEIKNTVVLKTNSETVSNNKYFKASDTGGNGVGEKPGRIKIVKIDQDNNTIRLKNAEFKVTSKETGESFIVVTDENGEAYTDLVKAGQYDVEEIIAPYGYVKEDKTYTVAVISDQLSEQVFTNKKAETEVSVVKKWIGKTGTAATIRLLADGKELDRVTLTAATGWSHIFKNLPKFDRADGHEIKYTITEDKIDNYAAKITGDAKSGFTVENRYIPPETPNTGDDNMLIAYAISAVVAMIMLSLACKAKNETVR